MKIDLHETHDRLKDVKNQWEVISKGCMDCIRNVPDAVTFPFYVFAHPRTIELDEKLDLVRSGFIKKREDMPSVRMIWSPRITKPKAESNSYLFLARKNSDQIRVIWMLPRKEDWNNYAPGQLMHHEDSWISIQNFIHCKEKLEAPEKDGPTEANVREWIKIIAFEATKKQQERSNRKMMDNLWKTKPMI